MKVYSVVKNLDLKADDESVSAIIYQIVDLLMGDEHHATRIDKYGEKLSEVDTNVQSESAGTSEKNPAPVAVTEQTLS